jgi:muramoyltetrapeptide carboxypeptidase LdcA involved in peptidoglycan recycling
MSLRVIEDQLGLVPVEYPTTRQLGATPLARAEDLMAAFVDPSIGSVMASIGGDDQLTVLPHLDPDVFVSNPKRFFGYSDNTNFLNYLWRLGIVGYHGGSTMVHLSRAGGPHPVSLNSLRSALFTNDTVEIQPVTEYTDLSPEWDDISTLNVALPTTPEPGWLWHNADQVVTAPTWGGNLEILHWNLAAGRWIDPVESYDGLVLLLETSEEMPSTLEVFRMLRNVGERGLLSRFAAVVVAKPKAWDHSNQTDEQMRRKYREDQRGAVLQAMATYNDNALLVVGPDFGHTDPQYVLPYGGQMTIDGPNRRISVTY